MNIYFLNPDWVLKLQGQVRVLNERNLTMFVCDKKYDHAQKRGIASCRRARPILSTFNYEECTVYQKTEVNHTITKYYQFKVDIISN